MYSFNIGDKVIVSNRNNVHSELIGKIGIVVREYANGKIGIDFGEKIKPSNDRETWGTHELNHLLSEETGLWFYNSGNGFNVKSLELIGHEAEFEFE
ncbi:MAG: hypothetical protein ACRCX2_15550 [Paraclostridium sp.]